MSLSDSIRDKTDAAAVANLVGIVTGQGGDSPAQVESSPGSLPDEEKAAIASLLSEAKATPPEDKDDNKEGDHKSNEDTAPKATYSKDRPEVKDSSSNVALPTSALHDHLDWLESQSGFEKLFAEYCLHGNPSDAIEFISSKRKLEKNEAAQVLNGFMTNKAKPSAARTLFRNTVGGVTATESVKNQTDQLTEQYGADVVDDIMRYEAGQMDTAEMLNFFSGIIQSGLAWQLQGHYGRVASQLINQGWLDQAGNILKTVPESAQKGSVFTEANLKEGSVKQWLDDKISAAMSDISVPEEKRDEIEDAVYKAALSGDLGDGQPTSETATAIGDLVSQLAGTTDKSKDTSGDKSDKSDKSKDVLKDLPMPDEEPEEPDFDSTMKDVDDILSPEIDDEPEVEPPSKANDDPMIITGEPGGEEDDDLGIDMSPMDDIPMSSDTDDDIEGLKKTAKKVDDLASGKEKPCPSTGPAKDGRGRGKGMPGGDRRGRRPDKKREDVHTPFLPGTNVIVSHGNNEFCEGEVLDVYGNLISVLDQFGGVQHVPVHRVSPLSLPEGVVEAFLSGKDVERLVERVTEDGADARMRHLDFVRVTEAKPKLGSGARFKKLSKEIGKSGKVKDPDAVAAAVGRKKYGKKRFQKLAAKGKKKGESSEALVNKLLGEQEDFELPSGQRTLFKKQDIPPDRPDSYFSDDPPVVQSVSRMAIDRYGGTEIDYSDFAFASSGEEIMGREPLETEELIALLSDAGVPMEGMVIDQETTTNDIAEFLMGQHLGTWDNTYNYGWWGPTIHFGLVGPAEEEPYGSGILFMSFHHGGDVRGNYGVFEAYSVDSYAEEAPWYSYMLSVDVETDRGTILLYSDDTEAYRWSIANDETGALRDLVDDQEIEQSKIEDRLNWDETTEYDLTS
jgi:hypothetical protein